MWIVRQPEPGTLHHVIARFIDRDFLVPDEAARERYLTLLGRAMIESDWRCLAFAVMSSHVHLAMIGGHTPAERWLRRVHPPYATWLNVRLARIGPVFAGSPAIWAMRRDQELRLVSYLHNNPVRAGVVARARDSHWTSHRAYLGEMSFEWLDTRMGLQRLGVSAVELDTYVDAEVAYTPDHASLDGIRRAARRRGGLEVATPSAGAPIVAPLVARTFAHVRPDPVDVLRITGDVVGVQVGRMQARTRDSASVAARMLAVHSARAVGLSIASISSALGIGAQYGSKLGLRQLTEVQRAAVDVIAARLEEEVARVVRDARSGLRRDMRKGAKSRA